MKAYQAFADGLVSREITTVFGLMGDGNMYWMSAYAALTPTSLYPAWHEAGAVGMADGYAAATGSVGVATVTMGPGLVQSLGPLTAAVRTRRPLLLITAEVPGGVPRHAQSAEQAAWVEACGAGYVRVATPAELEPGLDEALAIARTGRPCVLAVLIDVFDAEVEAGFGPAPESTTPPLPVADAALARAADLLATAQAPVVVLGRGALGAVASIGSLGRQVGAVFGTTVGGKGALADDPFQLGVLGMMSNPFARSLVGGADVVLVVGAALDLYNSDGGHLFGNAAIVRVDDRDPSALWDPAPERVVHLTGDAQSAVSALASRLADRPARPGLRTDETLAGLQAELARQRALGETGFDDGPNPWDVVAVLDELLPADAYCVVGIGHFWYFVAPYLRGTSARRFQFGSGFALIGQALPLAVGAAAARPGGLVVAFEGDGSIAMNLPELQSAVRFGHDLMVIVMDNAGYGSEYHKLLRAGLDERDSTFAAPIDLVAVAQAMGVVARRADDTDALRSGLRDLVYARGVRLLVVSIAMSPMSEVYQRQHG